MHRTHWKHHNHTNLLKVKCASKKKKKKGQTQMSEVQNALPKRTLNPAFSLSRHSKPQGSKVSTRVFFYHFWILVGDSVRQKVNEIFSSRKIAKYLNQTIITLVPKCKNPNSFNHYFPISLCNIVYKIVSKIIVGRLRPLLPNLVSPLQTAFVLGRKGIDNAIIVWEIILIV